MSEKNQSFETQFHLNDKKVHFLKKSNENANVNATGCIAMQRDLRKIKTRVKIRVSLCVIFVAMFALHCP